MNEVKLSDVNYVKCTALKIAGITVKDQQYGNRHKYVISIDDFPEADKYVETTFDCINDIVWAFRDKLVTKKIKVVAA
jgi:hypothetical protein